MVSLQNTNNVISIGNNAFQYTGPMELELQGVTSIPGSNVFQNSAIKSFESNSLMRIENGVYTGGAFYNCANLKNFNAPNLTFLGKFSFNNCPSLDEITFDNVTSVSDNVFYGSSSGSLNFTKLTSVAVNAFNGSKIRSFSAQLLETLPASGTWSGGCFNNCTSLSSVDLPSCKYIGDYAFNRCSALSSINIPLVETIKFASFSDAGQFAINAPKLTNMDFGTFNGSKIRSFSAQLLETLPASGNWGGGCFTSCTYLVSVDLPSCKYIGKYAFYKCSSLSSINIPHVEFIGGTSLAECKNLTEITIRSESVAVLESTSAFDSDPKLQRIYVPSELVNSYKTATNWASYASKITAIPS